MPNNSIMVPRTTLPDRVLGWGIDRLAFLRNTWKASALDLEDRQFVSMLLSSTSPQDPFAQMADNDKRRVAMTVSWIYSAIRLYANSFASAEGQVKKYNGEEVTAIVNHPLEQLLKHPNDRMDINFLWQYTLKWMLLRGNGFWYLAPPAGNPDAIEEIWPIPADRVKVIPDKQKMIRGYQYTTLSGESKIILPQYVVHFQFPNPFSLLDGEAPLNAALSAMEGEIGAAKYQRDFYVTGRGMPRSIISVPEDTGERDFVSISAQIREDFEKEQKIIITRAGDLKATTLGISQRDMQILVQRQFSRDELDVAFLGFELHGNMSDSALKTKYRMFKDEIIHPTHLLVAGQITVQILERYYKANEFYEFEDVRAQDRALNVQERNVYWRVKELNEARQDLGLGPSSDPLLGKLLTPLASDPAFVAMLKGLSRTGTTPTTGDPQAQRRRPAATAALSEADAPVNVMTDVAAGKVALLPPPGAAEEGMRMELRQWEKVAAKEVAHGRNPGLYQFDSITLPTSLYYSIRGRLLDKEEVKSVFESVKFGRGGGQGRPKKEIQAVNAYQDDLEAEYADWADGLSEDLSKAPDDAHRKEIIVAALLLLLGTLIALGRKSIPDAMDLGLGDTPPSPVLIGKLSEFVGENEKYLNDSLIPDIRDKITAALTSPEIVAAFGAGMAQEVLRSVLGVFSARVAMYAGAWWQMLNWSRGWMSGDVGKKLKWNLDNSIDYNRHCQNCKDWGDRTYDSFNAMLATTGGLVPGSPHLICGSNCRCDLEAV